MMAKFKIKECEICNNTNLDTVLNLGDHPMCDDLIKLDQNKECNLYRIEILFCEICKTAHQKYQIPKKDLFPTSYHYRSRFTQDVLDGMKSLVNSYILKFGDVKNKLVLDIGCNDGSLLNFFKDQGAFVCGIEPTNASYDAKKVTKNIYQDYFSSKVANQIIKNLGKPDIISFTNVFAHIEDLKSVLNILKKLMKKETVLIIENHYLGSILDGNQFDTFYHEHPRSYSYTSFGKIAKLLDCSITHFEFPSRYGGNIRVFCSQNESLKIKVKHEENIIKEEKNLKKKFDNIKTFIESWKLSKKKEILNLYKKYGPLKGKAFPGRAAILIKLLELDHKIISAIYEKPNSKKINNYVPGTRIPIYSDNKMFKSTNLSMPIINFAWHIPDEIEGYLRKNNYTGEIINIVSKPT